MADLTRFASCSAKDSAQAFGGSEARNPTASTARIRSVASKWLPRIHTSPEARSGIASLTAVMPFRDLFTLATQCPQDIPSTLSMRFRFLRRLAPRPEHRLETQPLQIGEQSAQEQRGADPEVGWAVSTVPTVSAGGHAPPGSMHGLQQGVEAESEQDAHQDHGPEVDRQDADPQHPLDGAERRDVRGRSGHQEDEGRTRRHARRDEGGGDRHRAGRTDVEGDRNGRYEQHAADTLGPGQTGQIIGGDEGSDQRPRQDPYQDPQIDLRQQVEYGVAHSTLQATRVRRGGRDGLMPGPIIRRGKTVDHGAAGHTCHKGRRQLEQSEWPAEIRRR